MWELDHKESWAPKNWCFWTVVLEKSLESPLDCKEIKPVHPKGNQSWIFIGRTDAEAEPPILWPPDAKNWLIRKTLMLGKIEGRRRRGQQRMRWLDGITDSMDMSLSKPLELGDGQGSLVCYRPWGGKESDMTVELNCTELGRRRRGRRRRERSLSWQCSCPICHVMEWSPAGCQVATTDPEGVQARNRAVMTCPCVENMKS